MVGGSPPCNCQSVAGKVETLPFVEIDKVAVFDGKLCLWRRGQDEPAMKISPDSKNAAVLTALLSEWVEHQRETGQHGLMAGGQSESAAGASGMGRLLFERGRNEGFQRGIVVAGIAGAAGVTMLFNRDFMPVGVFLLVIASASLLLGLFFGRYLFRCYELGLSSRCAATSTAALRRDYGTHLCRHAHILQGQLYWDTLTLDCPRTPGNDPLLGEGAEH